MDDGTIRYEQAGEVGFNIDEEVEASTNISLKKINLLREIFVTQMNNLALLPLAAVFICIDTGQPSGIEYIWPAIGIVPVAFYLFRIKFKSFFLLLAAHLAVILAAGFIFSDSAGRLFYIISCIIYAVYSLVVRMRSADFQDSRMPVVLAVGIAAASLLFLSYIYTDGSFDLQITVSFIITFALSLLVTYLESYINFIIVNRSSAGHIPAAEIFMSGSFMAVGCVVMFVLVLLATSGIGWLQTILKGAGSVVAAVLRIIFSMIGTDESSDFVDDTHVEGGMASDIIYDSEPALIWEILTVISVIFIAAAFIYLLFRTFKWLYLFIRERMQYKVPVGDDNSFEAVMEVREKYKAVEKSSGKNRNFLKNLFRNFSANEKIRRLYKKHVLKYSNDLQGGRLKEADLNRPEFITAGEWGRALGKPVISEIYDRARYSDTECTTDDYKLMKQVINNHSPQINAD